ncbi:HalOD1 output domain-containing protein [Halorientalis sp. IM1011]|uniref:HalOD1 output domain-containing protein n=1 Tax=Halorientalis sp. IM1011 TaxID=1932360 RepID=UPI0009FC433B|nr:HalOD1 output domain-containing protein [Halorientalis sp. IM1011]
MTSYERLAERLIETQRTMIGKRAVDIARSVEGLSVTDDGAVETVVDDDRTVLDELVLAYTDVMGESARTRLTDVASEYEDLTLPETLGGPSADEETATDTVLAVDESGDEEATAAEVDDAVAAAEDDAEEVVTNIWGDDVAAETEAATDPSPIDVVEGSFATIYVTVTGERGEGPVPVGQLIVDAVVAETDIDPGDMDRLSSYVSADEIVALAEDPNRTSLSFSIEGHEVRLDEDGTVTVP